LLVDDDEAFRRVLGRALSRRDYIVQTAAGIDDALKLAEQHQPSLALVDLKLENETGLDLIPLLKKQCPDIQIIVLTGYASIATAVTAIKKGALNYLCKPVTAAEVVKAFEGEVEPEDPDDYSPMSVGRMEWEHIQKVLAENDGNISATARSLGMYRRSLQRKLAKKPVAR